MPAPLPGPRTALSLALAAALATGAPSPAADPAVAGERDDAAASDRRRAADGVPAEHERAIARGLAWLAAAQLEDGSFPSRPEGDRGGRSSAEGKTALTALATLAFLGGGHGLRHGPHRDAIQKAVRWLLRAQHRAEPRGSGDDGYISFGGDGLSRMHGHGYATLALAEAYATAGNPREARQDEGARDSRSVEIRSLASELREAVERAVTLIQRSQSNTGGWGYVPGDGGTSSHEGSVTVCEVQALLAAANRGFRVDMWVVEKGRTYMKKSQDPVGGGFKYKLSEEGFRSVTFALTGAGISSLLGLGEFDRADAIQRGIRFMQQSEPRGPDEQRTKWFFYGVFYGTQAYRWVGGDRWENYWIPLRNRILNAQQPEGCWAGGDTTENLGPVYPTAMMLLTLEIPVGYLSIFAR